MPQLQLLQYGHGSHLLKRDLLGSVACQPRLVSLHLLGRWPEAVDSAPVLRLQDMAHLLFVRLDLECLENSSCLRDIALPDRCFTTLVLIEPQFKVWSPVVFPSLTSLCIKWRECDSIMAQPMHMLVALRDSPKIECVDLTYPRGFKVTGRLSLPQTLSALRLRVKGRTKVKEPLHIRLHAGIERLTLQLWGSHIVILAGWDDLEYFTDMHVEAATIGGLSGPLEEVFWELGGQDTVRVPHEDEIYGGGGGRAVEAAHMGPWPPSMPEYDGPDVPEARACFYWPCTCGACESCWGKDFWRMPGSG